MTDFPSNIWSGAGFIQNKGDGPNNSEWDALVAEVKRMQQAQLDGSKFCMLRTNSVQSSIAISTSPVDIDGWDGISTNDTDLFTGNSAAGTITISKAGIYLIGYGLSFTSDAAASFIFDLVEATIGTLSTHTSRVMADSVNDESCCGTPLVPRTVTAGQVYKVEGSVVSGTPNFQQIGGQLVVVPLLITE
jgi:hypothetical protein